MATPPAKKGATAAVVDANQTLNTQGENRWHELNARNRAAAAAAAVEGGGSGGLDQGGAGHAAPGGPD